MACFLPTFPKPIRMAIESEIFLVFRFAVFRVYIFVLSCYPREDASCCFQKIISYEPRTTDM